MATWSVTVTLAGANITARCLGSVRIEARRGVARICELSYRPACALALASVEGRTLTIAGSSSSSVGSSSGVTRFTGIVISARQSLADGVVRLMARDTLKEQANAATLAQMQAWCPAGIWHRKAFGEKSSGYRQLQDLASTTWGTVQCGPTDTPAWASWDAAALALVSLPRWLLGSERETAPDVEALVNRYRLTIRWTHARAWRRGLTVSWDWGNGLGSGGDPWTESLITGGRYWQSRWPLPTADSVLGIDGQAGWSALLGCQAGSLCAGEGPGFNSTYIPGQGWYDADEGTLMGPGDAFLIVDGDYFLWLPGGDWARMLTQFSLELERRGTQDVVQEYLITLQAPDSITRYGAREQSETIEIGEPWDSAEWEAGQGRGAQTIAYQLEDGTIAQLTVGPTVNAIGSYVDLLDADARDTAIACILRSRAYGIRAWHRHELTVDLPWALHIELAHAVQLAATGGMTSDPLPVQSFVDVLTFPAEANGWQGSALTTLTLALSRCGTVTAPDDALAAPTAPGTAWSHTPGHPATIALQNHIGGYADAPEWDEEGMVGWRANRTWRVDTVPEDDPTVYQSEGWRVELPDVEDEMTDPVEGTASATIDVSIPHQALTVTGLA